MCLYIENKQLEIEINKKAIYNNINIYEIFKVNLTKIVQDQYTENYKTLQREI